MKIYYGITPPRADYSPAKIKEVSEKRIERFRSLDPDALVLYDVQEESGRNGDSRPFPWTPTLSPLDWDNQWLSGYQITRIYYRPVTNDTEEFLTDWLQRVSVTGGSVVFVGAVSSNHRIRMPLTKAYRIRKEKFPTLPMGGIAIPERHGNSGREHLRMIEKIRQGCSFFITQCVYDCQTSLDFLSDYHYGCLDHNIDPVPIYLTHTPCGSLQTLNFMKWLGIGIPRWLENELSRSTSILDESVRICLETAGTLHDFCMRKEIPHGFNIESVSIRKEEIEASVQLFKSLRQRHPGSL